MSRHLSPTAQLLRSSRLFSLPQPLPKPIVENQVVQGYRRSDTATNPYPIYQALATPDSSLCRGDWGFKRPLPVRATTESTTPIMRLTALDTIEHITDYETASDHAITLKKFQEMKIAVVRTDIVPALASQGKVVHSAFEPAYDYTDKETAPKRTGIQDKPSRWKFTQSVKDLTEGEFRHLVYGKLESRKGGFYQFVRSDIRRQYIREVKEEADAEMKEGEHSAITGGSPGGHPSETLPHTPGMASPASQQEQDDAAKAAAATRVMRVEYLSWLLKLENEKLNHYLKSLASDYGKLVQKFGPGSQTSVLDQQKVEQAFTRMIPSTTETEGLKLMAPRTRQKLLKAGIPRYSYMYELTSDARSSGMLAKAAVIESEFFHHKFAPEFEQYYQQKVHVLRSNTTELSPLNKLIREFLDMAPIVPSSKTTNGKDINNKQFTTHPSAGISYLLTNGVLDNHPILGPQSRRSPIESRVLMARSADRSNQPTAKFGVGGFVVKDNSHVTDNDVANIDISTDGGKKKLLDVRQAEVNQWGKIILTAARPDVMAAEQVKNGLLLTPPQSEIERYRRPAFGSPTRFGATLDSPINSFGDVANALGGGKKTTHDSISRLQGILNRNPAAKQPVVRKGE